MSNEDRAYPRFSYDEHARTCAPDDLLGQVCRTVRGVPVTDEQVQMILSAIKAALDLKRSDTLLELACGNGVLSKELFGVCGGYLGTDVSEYLISVAKKNFEKLPDYRFEIVGALDCVRRGERPYRFTKALCYAGLQYFPDEEAVDILRLLKTRFANVCAIFIGNLPDRNRAAEFYKQRQPGEEELSDPCTAIGIWRTQEQFARLATIAGWKASFSLMPSEFHSSYYRYDALLSR